MDLDWSVGFPMRYLPVDTYESSSTSAQPEFELTEYAMEVVIGEATTAAKNVYFSIKAGLGKSFTFYFRCSSGFKLRRHVFNEFWCRNPRIFRKANPTRGYWLGTYLGITETIPFFFTNQITSLNFGYKSQMTRHLALKLELDTIY